MPRPNSRNGVVYKWTSDTIGRYSDENLNTSGYSNYCYRGNHKNCKGLNRSKERCTCPKCKHPDLPEK